MASPARPQDAAQLLAWFQDFYSQEYGIRRDCLTPEADFAQDLGVTSLDWVHLVMVLEEEWAITISDEAAASLRTIGEAIALLLQLRSSPPLA